LYIIFEDCRIKSYSAGPSLNASARRNKTTPRLYARAFAFGDGRAKYAFIRRSSKINISLTITKIAKVEVEDFST